MRFGQYEMLGRLAVGGMAEIYRGRAIGDEGFEKPVAIKRILPHFARDSRFVTMLVTEARIHSSLSHKNIVQIHDLGISEEGEYFIVLEYVDGRDLGALLDVLARRSAAGGRLVRLSDALALYVMIELGEGVHLAHELSGPEGQPLGLVHRDISPSNVLLSYAGEVKLSDFGLAKRNTDHSVVGSLKGKLAYMSPEQARRAVLDRRTDIFALGAVLYEMLTGRRLREITDEVDGWRQVASGLVPSARAHRPDLSASLERLLAKALAPDPRDRFPDARALVAAAREALASVERPPDGEVVALQELMRSVLPPGTPRPPSAPSKVIRLVSEFLPPERTVRAPIPGGPQDPNARTGRASKPPSPGLTPPKDAEAGRPITPARGTATPPESTRGAGASAGSGESSRPFPARTAEGRPITAPKTPAVGQEKPGRPVEDADPTTPHSRMPPLGAPRPPARSERPPTPSRLPAAERPPTSTKLPALERPPGAARPPTPSRVPAVDGGEERAAFPASTSAQGPHTRERIPTLRGAGAERNRPPTPARLPAATASERDRPPTPARVPAVGASGDRPPLTPLRLPAVAPADRPLTPLRVPILGNAGGATLDGDGQAISAGVAAPGDGGGSGVGEPRPTTGSQLTPGGLTTRAPADPERTPPPPREPIMASAPQWEIDDDKLPLEAEESFDDASDGAGVEDSAEEVIRAWPTLDTASPPPSVRGPRPRPVRSFALLALSLIPALAALVHEFVIPLPVLASWNEPARLDVATQPPGAEVLLDGRPLSAVTPTFTEVRRDRVNHLVEVRKEGFQPTRRPLRFDQSEALVVTVSLQPESRPSFQPMPVAAPDPMPTAITPAAARP